MACEAAKRHVAEVLRRRGATTAEEAWKRVGWWTRETISEALDELAEAGAVERTEEVMRYARFYDLAGRRA